MKHPPGCPTHMCAPKEFRRTPNLTGSFELDKTIHQNPNKNMRDRLAFYAGVQSGHHRDNQGYGPRTNYDGYDGYSGDE